MSTARSRDLPCERCFIPFGRFYSMQPNIIDCIYSSNMILYLIDYVTMYVNTLCIYIIIYISLYLIMSAYIKKMESKQKQHAFPVVAWCQGSDSRT